MLRLLERIREKNRIVDRRGGRFEFDSEKGHLARPVFPHDKVAAFAGRFARLLLCRLIEVQPRPLLDFLVQPNACLTLKFKFIALFASS